MFEIAQKIIFNFQAKKYLVSNFINFRYAFKYLSFLIQVVKVHWFKKRAEPPKNDQNIDFFFFCLIKVWVVKIVKAVSSTFREILVL